MKNEEIIKNLLIAIVVLLVIIVFLLVFRGGYHGFYMDYNDMPMNNWYR